MSVFRRSRPSWVKPGSWQISELESRLLLAGDVGPAVAAATTADAPATAMTVTHLVIVDAGVEEISALTDSIPANADLVLLDADRDGIAQITEVLADRRDLQSVHVISHGSDAVLRLGSTDLTPEMIARRESELRTWSRAFDQQGDLLLYGCDLAATSRGRDMVGHLAALVDVDVAASDDRTGNATERCDADWELEHRIGEVTADQWFDPVALASYRSHLDITIYAAGSTGDELMELVVGGEVVNTWFVLGTDAEDGRFFPYSTDIDGASIDDIRINFVNDLFDPAAGIDRNLRVDRIEVDGRSFETEDASTFVEGAWVDGVGITSGNVQTEYLATDGFFQFSSDGGGTGGGGTTIDIVASGDTGDEDMQLLVDGRVVATFSDVSTGTNTYSFNVEGNVTADRVRVAFINSVFDPANGYDQNLNVDFIRVDGQRFQTEASSTFSTGTWTGSDVIAPGYPGSETLHIDGYFQYLDDGDSGGGDPSGGDPGGGDPGGGGAGTVVLGAGAYSIGEDDGTLRVSIVRDGDFSSSASVQYFTENDSAVAGLDYVSSSGTVFFDPGQRTADVFVDILNDSDGEGSETFSIRLGAPDGASLLAPRTATIRILDDDSSLPLYNDFAGAGNLQLNGDAIIDGSSLRLTDATAQQRGSAYFQTPVSVDDSTSFETRFSFRLNGGQGNGGGEGFAFVLQNSPAGTFAQNLGDFSGGLNYNAVSNSVAVEFDTFKNPYESFADELTVVANGTPVTPVANIASPLDWNNGQTYNVWVDYNGDSNVLAVYATTGADKPVFALLRANVDLAGLVGNQMYVGFAAATGTAFNNTFIDRWNFTLDTPPADPPVQPTDNRVRKDLYAGFEAPTNLKFADNDRVLLVAEQAGVVKAIRDGQVRTVLDIRDRVNFFQDRGLIGLEVHPDFENTPYLYLAYTYDPPEVDSFVGNRFAGPDGEGNRAARMIRVTLDASAGYTSVVAGSERLLLGSASTWDNYNGFIDSTLDISAPQGGINRDGSYIRDFVNSDSRSHTIGDIAFAADGSLYVSTGDGASFNQTDPRAFRVQDPNSLAGKILRIDPITGRGLADNPFFDGDPDSNRSKVYQLGLRNPWRLVSDTANDRLYIGETGLSNFEEINVGGAGANFGWPAYEGGQGFNQPTPTYAGLPQSQAIYNQGGISPAFVAMPHGTGPNVIVAGDIGNDTVYGGQFDGDLFYNDLGRGVVRHAEIGSDGRLVRSDIFATDGAWVTDMQLGDDGYLYYVNYVSGTVGRWEFA